MSQDNTGSNGGHPRRPDRPPRLEGYELLGEVGRGDAGVVYKARQRDSGRLVAVQVAYRGQPEGPSERARKAREDIKAEAEAAVALEHPNLVPLLEFGCAEGRHYCVTGWVEGGTLAQRLFDGPLPDRRAATYVAAAARAVHHAHMHGLVHRDLKPANIRIDPDDRPLVAGFGVTGWLNGGEEPGAALGTPAYLAPEQARGAWADAAADVYALGATLYHALTGRPPFQSATDSETIRQVLADEPLPPRRLNPAVDRDLELMVLKCLEKDPRGRYDSAAGLADDLRRYLDGEAIRPPGPRRLARLRRSFRQHPAATALTVALAFAVLACATVVLFGMSRLERVRASRLVLAEEERARAELEAQAAARQRADLERRAQDPGGVRLAARTLRLADAEWQAGRPELARDLLEEVPAALRRWEWHFLKRRVAGGRVTLHGHAGPVISVAFSPDGTHVATVGGDGAICVWDVSKGEVVVPVRGRNTGRGDPSPATAVAYSPDGQRLATADADGTVRLWDARTGLERASLAAQARAIAFSPDGTRLATADSDGVVRLRSPADGKELGNLRGHEGAVLALAFGPDGRLASAGADRTVRVWDAVGGKELYRLAGPTGPARAVAFSPEGGRLAAAGPDRLVYLWAAAAGARPQVLEGHTFPISAAVFSPDGAVLATAGEDSTIRLWGAKSGAVLGTLRGHEGGINQLAFAPHGGALASAGSDGALKLWDLRHPDALVLRGHTAGVTAVALGHNRAPGAFALRGDQVVTAGRDGTVRLWGPLTGHPNVTRRGHAGPVDAVALSADDRFVASGGADGTVRLWVTLAEGDWGSDRRPLRPDERPLFPLNVFKGHSGPVTAVRFGFASRAHWVFSASLDGTIRVWPTGEPAPPGTILRGHTDPIHALDVSPGGTQLASGGAAGTVKVWDLDSGRVTLNLAGHVGRVTAVAFSPDGQRLATAGFDETVRVWGVAGGAELLVLKGHAGAVHSVAFSPDGQRLVSAGADRTIRLWGAQTGDELLTLTGHADAVTSVAFGSDGLHFASASLDGTARIWDGRAGPSTLLLRGHALAVRCVAFGPDGLRLASGGRDGTARVWDVQTGVVLLTLRGARGPVAALAFSADGQQLLGRDDSGRALGWDLSTGGPLPAPRAPEFTPGTGAASADGRLLAFAGRDGTVRVVERSPGRAEVLPNGEEPLSRLALAHPNVGWHEAEASRHERTGGWFAAAFHLDRLLVGYPGDVTLLLRRAQARAALGRRDEARADFVAAGGRLLPLLPGR
jgi:WD40 repeat protein